MQILGYVNNIEKENLEEESVEAQKWKSTIDYEGEKRRTYWKGKF